MKLYRFVFVVILPFLVSCTYKYDFGGDFTPSIVVNSTITPDSTIKVYLYWSKHIDDALNYKTVERFTAQIFKDGTPILLGEDLYGVDGVLSTSVYPESGFQYRLEVEVPNYDRLSAETTIPLPPIIDVGYSGMAGSQQHLSLDRVELATITRSVMISTTEISEESNEDGEEELVSRQAYSLFANNPFCDQFNAVIDMYDLENGSVTSYDDYIRVPYKNIDLSTPLKFSVRNFSYSRPAPILIGHDDFGYPVYKTDDFGYIVYEHIENRDSIRVNVIAPSDDYDMFHKSEYLQYWMNSTTPVHSNVINGLGSFMGYSSTSKTYKVKYD